MSQARAPVIDWTHPMHDRRRPVPCVQGVWAGNLRHLVLLVEAGHLALIGIPLSFAVGLLFNPTMFRELPNFRVFSTLGSERQWAAGLMAVCALSLACWRSRSWWWRCAALFALGTMHWLIAYCFLSIRVYSTGSGTYPILAALAWCYALQARLAR